MAKVFCTTRHLRNFSRSNDLGNRLVHCVRRRQSPAPRISHRASAAEEGGTPGLDRECKAGNANVIPSEVEAATQRTKSARPGFQSRGIIEWSHHGILRLRGAPLRMTAKERFNPPMLE
jgi:hypothetical protein